MFTLTSLFSAESSQKLDLARNPKYGYEIVSARADCSCELPLMLLPLFRSCLPRPHTHIAILKEMEGCATLGSLLKTEFHRRILSRMLVCHSFTLMIVCTAICGSSFTYVKINTEFCIQPAAALIQAGSLVAFTEGRTYRCNELRLFVNSFYHSDGFEVWVISRNVPASAQPGVSYKNIHLRDPGEV